MESKITDNLRIYNIVRAVPEEAQSPILAGRLKGMTDIKPIWRIEKLTELYGPCGIGWTYTEPEIEYVNGNPPEVICIARTSLSVREGENWSLPIHGIGGARFVTQEKNSVYTDDEAPKKALTDALSVACKALGIGADVYYGKNGKDQTKYSNPPEEKQPEAPAKIVICERCGKPITGVVTAKSKFTAGEIIAQSKLNYNGCYCFECMIALKAKNNGGAK